MVVIAPFCGRDEAVVDKDGVDGSTFKSQPYMRGGLQELQKDLARALYVTGLVMPHVELDVVMQHIDGVPLSEMALSRCVAVEQTRCGEYQDETDCFHCLCS